MNSDELIMKLKVVLGEARFEEIKLALLKAEQLHKKQVRDNGDPYVLHPLRVANILADELNIKDKNTIILALLHDVLEDTEITEEEIKELFGVKILEYLQLLTKTDDYKEDIDRQKKYFWHLKRAPKKVQVVKLADRLDNMRDLENCPDEKKKIRYVLDTGYNYLPWAKKIKPYIAGEIEDLIFKYKEMAGDT